MINVSANATFLFNATANTTTIGIFNITIVMANNTGINVTNISVTVNDTSAPTGVSFVSPTPTDYQNVSRGHILVNVSISDNLRANTTVVKIFNGSYSLVNNTNVSTYPEYFLNVSGLADGTYYINATANDTAGNTNATGTGIRTIILDTTAPVVTLARSSASTADSLVLTVTIGESGTGISAFCDVDDSTVTKTGSGSTSQTLTKSSGLSCGTTQSFAVTCTDYAGNAGSKSASFSTDACASSSGGGSSSSSSTVSWSNTYAEDNVELAKTGITKSLGQKERMKVLINGTTHYVGVKTISGTSVNVEIASTPQQSTIEVGMSKMFDTNSDALYDLQVTVQSIVAGKAMLLVQAISVPIQSPSSNSATLPSSSGNEAPVADVSGEPAPSSSQNIVYWIIGLLVILVIVGLIVKNRK